MKALHIISSVITVVLATAGLQSKAQTRSLPPGDTTTFVLYNNDANFDTKRTQIFTDKNAVDSLATILAADSSKRHRIVYRKQGSQGRVIAHNDYRKLNRAGFYQIMIAYNKKGSPQDDAPIYVVSGK